MDTIAIFHTKGGVAKSAVTVFLADFLASYEDKRVLVVDLDPQGSSSKALLGRDVLETGFKQGRSLPQLLCKSIESGLAPHKAAIQAALYKRPLMGKNTKRSTYLAELSILATDRAGWREFNEQINELTRDSQGQFLDLLKDTLTELEDDYDIALIDFPGSELPFWTKLGLRGSKWWLLPELPDYLSSEDLDTAVELVRDAEKNSTHKILPLGTLLTICPNRGSNSYKKARSAMSHLANVHAIPALFDKDCEILHRPDAQKATDWKSEKSRTLVARYGTSTSPFHTGLKKLSKAALKRVGQQSKTRQLSIVGDLRRKLTDYWRT